MATVNRAIVYLRVSTVKQTEGASLETQELMCQQWATRNNVIVDRIFHDDGASAKTLNRPAMKELLAYLKDHKGRIGYLITYQTDRLTRNASDFYALQLELSRYGVQYRNVNSSLESNLNDELIQGIEAVIAQHDNRIKSERVAENMRRHAKEGYRMSKAPYGLRNVRDILGRSTVEPIPEVANKVAALLKAHATGTYTMSSLLSLAKQIGLGTMNGKEVRFQTLSRILRQPLYAGLDKSDHTEGVLVKSRFEGIVTPAIFYRNQEILQKNKNTAARYKKINPLFPLRRFAICERCNKPLSGSSPTNGSGKASPRYHCTSRGCSSITPDIIHQQFSDMLGELQPTDETRKLLKEVIVKVWKRELQSINSQEKRLHRALERLREQKQQAIAKVVTGELTGAEKVEYVKGVNDEIARVQDKLAEISAVTSLREDAIDYALSFLGDSQKLWNNASVEHQIIYQSLLFPHGIYYNLNKQQFGTGEMSPLYRLANTKKNPSVKDESLLVISPGIEPGLPG